MEITRQAGGDFLISRLDRVLYTLLREVPDTADPSGDSRALDRLYSRPAGPDEADFVDDWQELVQPELQHLFESANETVRRDLAHAEQEEDGMLVTISENHVDAWINSLNQARLVLAARFGFGDKDMEGELPLAPLQPREFALFQVHLYGYIQECFIQLME